MPRLYNRKIELGGNIRILASDLATEETDYPMLPTIHVGFSIGHFKPSYPSVYLKLPLEKLAVLRNTPLEESDDE